MQNGVCWTHTNSSRYKAWSNILHHCSVHLYDLQPPMDWWRNNTCFLFVDFDYWVANIRCYGPLCHRMFHCCPIIFTCTIHSATLLTHISIILDTTKLIPLIGKPYLAKIVNNTFSTNSLHFLHVLVTLMSG